MTEKWNGSVRHIAHWRVILNAERLNRIQPVKGTLRELDQRGPVCRAALGENDKWWVLALLAKLLPLVNLLEECVTTLSARAVDVESAHCGGTGPDKRNITRCSLCDKGSGC